MNFIKGNIEKVKFEFSFDEFFVGDCILFVNFGGQ